jgi:DNA invertase Pin-like site-specific DNA recombinase
MVPRDEIGGANGAKGCGIEVQPPEWITLDRISRLPLAEAEQLVASIRAKGAKLSVPGVVDLSDFAAGADAVAKIVLESVQELLLKLALQMARDDYETRRERQRQGVQLAKAVGKYAGRIPDTTTHRRIVTLRGAGQTIKRTAELSGCSESQVKRIWAIHLAKSHNADSTIGDGANPSKG